MVFEEVIFDEVINPPSVTLIRFKDDYQVFNDFFFN